MEERAPGHLEVAGPAGTLRTSWLLLALVSSLPVVCVLVVRTTSTPTVKRVCVRAWIVLICVLNAQCMRLLLLLFEVAGPAGSLLAAFITISAESVLYCCSVRACISRNRSHTVEHAHLSRFRVHTHLGRAYTP